MLTWEPRSGGAPRWAPSAAFPPGSPRSFPPPGSRFPHTPQWRPGSRRRPSPGTARPVPVRPSRASGAPGWMGSGRGSPVSPTPTRALLRQACLLLI